EADRIVPALTEASRADSHNRALSLLLGRELQRAGRSEEAEQLYKKIIADAPAPDVYRGQYDLYREWGPKGGGEALRLLDKTVRGANANNGGDQRRGNGAGKQPVDPGRADQADGEATRGRAMLAALRENTGLIKLILDAAQRHLASLASQ